MIADRALLGTEELAREEAKHCRLGKAEDHGKKTGGTARNLDQAAPTHNDESQAL